MSDKQLLSLNELADAVGLHYSTLSRYVKDFEIPHTILGGRKLFDPAEAIPALREAGRAETAQKQQAESERQAELKRRRNRQSVDFFRNQAIKKGYDSRFLEIKRAGGDPHDEGAHRILIARDAAKLDREAEYKAARLEALEDGPHTPENVQLRGKMISGTYDWNTELRAKQAAEAEAAETQRKADLERRRQALRKKHDTAKSKQFKTLGAARKAYAEKTGKPAPFKSLSEANAVCAKAGVSPK